MLSTWLDRAAGSEVLNCLPKKTLLPSYLSFSANFPEVATENTLLRALAHAFALAKAAPVSPKAGLSKSFNKAFDNPLKTLR